MNVPMCLAQRAAVTYGGPGDGALNAAGCSGPPTPADKELPWAPPAPLTAGSPHGPNPVPRPRPVHPISHLTSLLNHVSTAPPRFTLILLSHSFPTVSVILCFARLSGGERDGPNTQSIILSL